MPPSSPTDLPALPRLAFVPLESLHLHEAHDERRTPYLKQRLLESGLFRHPPVVMPLSEGRGDYLVLDGANRTVTLRRLGMRHVPVQITTPDEPGLALRHWNHVLYGWDPAQLLTRLSKLNEAVFEQDPGADTPTGLHAQGTIEVHLWGGPTLAARPAKPDLEGKVSALNAVVDTYAELPGLDRTTLVDLEELAELYPGLTALIAFPELRLEELEEMATRGLCLPTGITRTLVSPRTLGLDVPLAWLNDERSLEEKNAALQKLIETRLAEKRVRYYGEATVMYDE